MALLLKKAYQSYHWIIDDLADPRTKDNPFFSSYALFCIIAGYYYVIKVFGPKFMEKRKPFEIRNILIIYNVIQIVANMWLTYEAFQICWNMNWWCQEIDYSDSQEAQASLKICRYYYYLKLFDFLDTIFFILRKSFRQVSFLHFYHHNGVFLAAWVGNRYFAGGESLWIPLLNCFVHVLMYAYYLLTAMNGSWKKVFWIKKLMTQIQLLQFSSFVLLYTRLLIVPNCNYPKFMPIMFLPQNLFITVLFTDFYLKTYVFKNKIKKS